MEKFKVKFKPRTDNMIRPGDILTNYINIEGDFAQVRVKEIWNVRSNVQLEGLTYAAMTAADSYEGASGSYKILVETIGGDPLSHFMSGSRQSQSVRKVYESKVSNQA